MSKFTKKCIYGNPDAVLRGVRMPYISLLILTFLNRCISARVVFDEEKFTREAWRLFKFLHGEETKQHLERDVTNTGNGERGTGERGTGNGERGTGNGERGTGVWE